MCGAGASGRNGGFALTFWHHFTGLVDICGVEEAIRLAHASEDAVDEIGRFCQAHGIDAEYRRDGWLWTATNGAQMNAWSSALRELRNAYVTVSSDIVLTEAVPDELERIGWRDGMGISDSRLMVHYYRTTPGGRVAFGKGTGAVAFGARVDGTFDGPSPRADVVAAALRATYPSLADVRLEAGWGGPIDRSVDGLPFFTTLSRPDLVCGLGFSGNGVGPSVMGGKVLASLALGRRDEWSQCGLDGQTLRRARRPRRVRLGRARCAPAAARPAAEGRRAA